MKILHFAKVENRRVIHLDPHKWNKQLIGLEGEVVQITIEKRKKPRSNEQNRYYWGVVVKAISIYTGYTANEAHDALREHFLSIPTDNALRLIKSTTSLSTVEFEEYMMTIREWASAQEPPVYIPLPQEVDY